MRRWTGALTVVVLLVSGCGSSGATDSGALDEETATSDPAGEVACSVGAETRFSSSFLEGPDLSPSEFVETEVGAMMEAFFTDGPGGPESGQYLSAEGFSFVSDSLVIGYRDGLPDSAFDIEGGTVAGWGDCRPSRVAGDLAASRWEPIGPLDPDKTVISIQVEGGACVTGEGTDVLTEVVAIETDETENHVEITAWTRDKPFPGPCAGIGVSLDSEIELASPLGTRSLLDGGTIPARMVSVTTGDTPPASEPDSSLGRLECSPGVVVEERVLDTGQDPLEIARGFAPDVVEVESDQPLWWWGLNAGGAVIVAVARGDAPGADYQVWTCDPQHSLESAADPDVRLPEACSEFEELYPGANDLPEGGEVVAEFPFREGTVVLVRNDRPDASHFSVIECFPGGGEGFSGGEPGETWQGCYRIDYSDAGYAIAIVENPLWDVAVAGDQVDVVPAGSVGAAFIEGTFDRPPTVNILSDETNGC